MGFKGSEKLKIDQKWWSKNKPVTLKSTGLGAAMKEYATARTAAEKFSAKGEYATQVEREKSPIAVAREKLAEVMKTVTKAKSMCNKTLHKETIKVLSTGGDMEKAEAKDLTNLESTFNSTYQKNVIVPLDTQLKSATSDYTKLKSDAHACLKKAETDLSWVSGMVKYSQTVKKDDPTNVGEFKKILSESTAKVKEIQKTKAILDKLHKTSETNINAVKAVINDRRIGNEEQKYFIPLVNKVNELRNAVTMYQNKVSLMTATAESQLEEITATLSGKPTLDKTHKATIEKVAAALKGWGEDARRQNNNLTPWQAQVRQYLAAKQRARGGKTIEEVAQEMSIGEPPDTWKKIADGFVTDAPRFIKKTDKMLLQAEELKAKTIAKIPSAVLGDPGMKTHLKDIDNRITEIREYTIKNQDSFAELKKAAAALAK